MDASKPLVAIVDDEESVRRALERLIRSVGLLAETFASGDEFLAALGRMRPDCVVLDLHMPDTTGFEILDRMAPMLFGPPVIVLTGHDTAEAESQVRAAGVVAYLPKPVDKKTLLRAITSALGSEPAAREDTR